jgi:hypothetical protein
MAIDTQDNQQDLLVSASLLRKIDRLREKNIGKHVPLPQVRLSSLRSLMPY